MRVFDEHVDQASHSGLRNPKTSRLNSTDLAGAHPCGKFVVSRAEEAYDALLESGARLELMTVAW
jgi:hypothetical protein